MAKICSRLAPTSIFESISKQASIAKWSRAWPLERVMFALAGTMTIVSAVLAAAVSPWFLLLTAFVGLNQWAYVALGACPSSLLISKLFGFRSACAANPSS